MNMPNNALPAVLTFMYRQRFVVTIYNAVQHWPTTSPSHLRRLWLNGCKRLYLYLFQRYKVHSKELIENKLSYIYGTGAYIAIANLQPQWKIRSLINVVYVLLLLQINSDDAAVVQCFVDWSTMQLLVSCLMLFPRYKAMTTVVTVLMWLHPALAVEQFEVLRNCLYFSQLCGEKIVRNVLCGNSS